MRSYKIKVVVKSGSIMTNDVEYITASYMKIEDNIFVFYDKFDQPIAYFPTSLSYIVSISKPA